MKAPLAARKFKPGQFYRLQNFETCAPVVEGTRLAMEGLALTGAWVDEEKGLLGTIVLEMGGSLAPLRGAPSGRADRPHGPDGRADRDRREGDRAARAAAASATPCSSRSRAPSRRWARRSSTSPATRTGEDLFKQDDIERYTDQVIWSHRRGRRDRAAPPAGRALPRQHRAGDGRVRQGRARQEATIKLSEVKRIIAIGSDRMMAAVREARHGVLQPILDPRHLAIGSINSPMQCMMKEVCAQCLQKHVDPKTGKETLVFSCFNQDQELDSVDFKHLNERLRANSMQEKVANAWLDHLLALKPEVLRI